MIETILLPTDGSDCARAATSHAAAIARAYDATVHVLTVVESIADDVAGSQRDRAAERRIEPVVEDLERAGVETATAVAEGIPAEAILAAADERAVDLLAMGTHGRSGLRRQLLGSVTERVLRQSDVPVLAVPERAGGDTPSSYEDVLAPTDGSEGAEAARPLAFDLAGAFDATVHALSVVETRAVTRDVGATVVLEQFEDIAEDAVEDLAAAARDADVGSVVTAVVQGVPHRTIDTYAADNGVDLVVVGTHGRTGLDRYLLGSVTENLLRTTDIPVLAVRAPEDED